MTDKENKAENTFSKKIGKTNYKVTVHFSETSNETITDKINRLIQKECEDMSYKKDSNSKQKWPRQEERTIKEPTLYRYGNRLSQKYIRWYLWSRKAICFTYL